MNSEFYERAAILGHDPALLERGLEQTVYGKAAFREIERIISCASAEQKRRRLATFFNPPVKMRSRLGQGVHDRGEAAAFAAEILSDSDMSDIARHFPACIKTSSIPEKTIMPGEVWDVTANGDEWDEVYWREIYNILNIGTLTIRAGGCMVVRGNIFSMLCQRLVTEGAGCPGGGYHIGILPTPFAVDFKHGPDDGPDGARGEDGRDGRNGTEAAARPGMLGTILLHAPPYGERCGTDGADGADGEDGSPGRNGGMCRTAEITVRELCGRAVLFAQAGKGGDGGCGGDGGNGGNGGDGASGFRHVTGVLDAGDGGNGGNGGRGGNGADGGNGGIASNIYVNVPERNRDGMTFISLPSEKGIAGKAGRGGEGGRPGKAGNAAAENPGSRAGTAGKEGSCGKDGRSGRQRPAPWIFLDDEPVNH